MFLRIVHFLVVLWGLVGLLLVVLLFGEFGVDAWRRASRRLRRGGSRRADRTISPRPVADPDWTVDYLGEFHRNARLDWKAHVTSWQRPFQGSYLTIDGRGLRPTPGEENGDPHAVRILCFGGSALVGTGARDHATIPAILARRLRELGHAVAVVNYGQLGHNSTQEVITLQQQLKAGTRIDIAVFYDGVNEMICADQTGRADAIVNEAHRRAEFNLMHPERRGHLLVAALMALLPRMLRRLRRLSGRPLRGPFPPVATDLSLVDVDALAHEVVGNYVGNLRLVRALAAEYGFRPLFFWMPVLTTKRIKTADEQRWERDYTRQPERRSELWNATAAERRAHPDFAAAVDSIDLSALFDDTPQPVYIDLYHLSEGGNAIVAEAMLPRVTEALREY